MTAVALGAALIALAVAVMALLKLNALEKATDEALRDIRAGLSVLRTADEARMIREAEAGMTPSERAETILPR